AHITYPQIAREPAGYSPRWIRGILREETANGGMGFRGIVFSDDIGMAAAHSAGGIKARVAAHLDAGCDVVLVCHPQMVEEALRSVETRAFDMAGALGLLGRGATDWNTLLAGKRHAEAGSRIASVPVLAQDSGATSGAINVGDAA
ncbi:MAG: hypothetical protein EOP93_24975, partial [Lysobacteraceae bacterium]